MSGIETPTIESLTAEKEKAMRDLFDERIRRDLLNLRIEEVEKNAPTVDEERMKLMRELMKLQDENQELEELQDGYDDEKELMDDIYALDIRINGAELAIAQKQKEYAREDKVKILQKYEWEQQIRDMKAEEVHVRKEKEALETIVRNTTAEEKWPMLEELFTEKKIALCNQRFANDFIHYQTEELKNREEDNQLLREMIAENWPQKPGRTVEQIETDLQVDIQMADLARKLQGDRCQYRSERNERSRQFA